MKRIALLILIFLVHDLTLCAGNLEKAFERLDVYDYFKARELFIKSMKKDPAAAAYGLSEIHSSENNPFYNLDSARNYILVTDSIYPLLKEKQQVKYAILGVTPENIQQRKDSICTKALLAAEQGASIELLNHYLTSFSFCGSGDQVTSLRNSVAFQEARALNTAAGYKKYLEMYPESEEVNDAQNRYHERLFEEETESHQLGAYERFLKLYPESPYKMQAERMIFTLSTSQGSLAEHKAFIKRYPENRYVRESWREIYRICMQNYDEQTYLQFKFDYPDYPFMDELENDYMRQTSVFLPFKKNGLWGFINEEGAEMIEAVYEEVNYFSEGLAAVSKNDKYGYINKSGKVMIPFMWDDAEAFKNNCAVVSKQNKSGLINKSGEFLIPLEYEELTEPVEDICVVMNNEKSGYIYRNGNPITKLAFDMAADFHDGFAIVEIDELYGLIDAKGNLVFDAEYEHLSWASADLLRVGNSGSWGLINRVGEEILPIEYEAVGDFHDGLALIARNSKCGFVDTKGKIIIPLNYRFAENLLTNAVFSNGYVVISNKGKNIVLDTVGVRIQFPGYENTGRPSEGLIPVQKNRKWGYVDYHGKIKIPCTYQEAYSFNSSSAIVKTDHQLGIIDSGGKWILEPTYDDISRTGINYILSKQGMFGIALGSGQIIAPCEYDRVEILFDQVAMLQRGDGRAYVSMKNGKMIWTNLQ